MWCSVTDAESAEASVMLKSCLSSWLSRLTFTVLALTIYVLCKPVVVCSSTDIFKLSLFKVHFWEILLLRTDSLLALIIFKAASRIVRRTLFYLSLFPKQTSNPRDALSKVCQRLGLGPHTTNSLKIFCPSLSTFLPGIKKCIIWPQFSTLYLRYEVLLFQNEA